MKRLLTAATAAALSLAAAPAANAEPMTFPHAVVSNADGSVRCEIMADGPTTFTHCVNDNARASQPKCTGNLMPRISLGRYKVGRDCWSMGFANPPQRLRPLQSRMHGSAIAVAGFNGEIYVYDFLKIGLIRAGNSNDVLFSLLYQPYDSYAGI